MERTPVVVAWTLKLEIAFYVVAPIAAWSLGLLPNARRIPALFWAGVVSVVLTVSVMVVAITSSGTVTTSSLATFPSIAWAFVPGMIVAELEARRGLDRAPLRALAAGGVALICLSANP